MSLHSFDKLVELLSVDERRTMLDKISRDSLARERALPFVSMVADRQGTISQEYARLGFFRRLWFEFLSYFDKRSKEEVFHQSLLSSLKREVNRLAFSYIDFSAKRFKKDFCLAFSELADVLRFLRRPLDNVVGLHKADFYAFLVGLVEPLVQEKLLKISSLSFVSAQFKKKKKLSNTKARITMEESIDEVIQSISSKSKEKLYLYAKQIAYLERLVNFNYEKIITNYSTDNTCTMRLIFRQLVKFDSIIHSLNTVPDEQLLKSIFIFNYPLKDISSQNLIENLQEDLQKAECAINAIRNFLKIPLSDILCIISDNYFYNPKVLSGGEDWFVLYRKFWHRRAIRVFQRFLLEQKIQKMDSDLLNFYKIDCHPYVNGYRTVDWPKDFFLPIYERSIGLIYFFFSKIYPTRCNYIIQKLSNEGHFFKKEYLKELIGIEKSVSLLTKEIDEFQESISISNGYFYTKLYNLLQTDQDEKFNSLNILIENKVEMMVTRGIEILQTLISAVSAMLLDHRNKNSGVTVGNKFEIAGIEKIHFDRLKDLFETTYQFLVDKRNLEKRFHNLHKESKDSEVKVNTMINF